MALREFKRNSDLGATVAEFSVSTLVAITVSLPLGFLGVTITATLGCSSELIDITQGGGTSTAMTNTGDARFNPGDEIGVICSVAPVAAAVSSSVVVGRDPNFIRDPARPHQGVAPDRTPPDQTRQR